MVAILNWLIHMRVSQVVNLVPVININLTSSRTDVNPKFDNIHNSSLSEVIISRSRSVVCLHDVTVNTIVSMNLFLYLEIIKHFLRNIYTYMFTFIVFKLEVLNSCCFRTLFFILFLKLVLLCLALCHV